MLSAALAARGELFEWVDLPADSPFFRRDALLFLEPGPRARLIGELSEAQPLIGRLNRDPGLKSVAELFDDALNNPAQVRPSVLQRFAIELADTIDGTLAGQVRSMSWRGVLAGNGPGAGASADPKDDGRQLVIRVAPVLDFQQLLPAQSAMLAVRSTAQSLQLTPEHGIRVRITGGLAMRDEELRTVSEGGERAAVLAATLLVLPAMVRLLDRQSCALSRQW